MDLLPQWVLVAEEELQKAIEEENQAAGIGKDGRK